MKRLNHACYWETQDHVLFVVFMNIAFTFLFSPIEPKKLVIQELMSGRMRETS